MLAEWAEVLRAEGVDDDPVREIDRMLSDAERLLRDLAEHCGVELGHQ